MLNVEPVNLQAEARESINFREKWTDIHEELIHDFAGNWYRSDWQPDGPVLENHAAEFVTNILPQLVHTNPKTKVKSRRPIAHAELTKGLKIGLDNWVQMIEYDRTLRAVAMDMLFGFGCSVSTLVPVPGYEGIDGMRPHLPKLKRLSPKRFFLDAQCTDAAGWRFAGHVWVRDKEDLLAAKLPNGKPMYRKAVVEQLAAIQKKDLDRGGRGQYMDGRSNVWRDQIAAVEIFVPEHKLVFTLPLHSWDGVGVEFLREPRDYFGPPWGPYNLYGIYAVPDQIYPLSPLAMSQEAVEELNAHAAAASRAAAREKEIVLVDSAAPSVYQAVQEGQDGWVYKVAGLSGAVQPVKLGATTDTRLNYIAMLRDRLDRRSGLHEIQRGNVSGGTATAVAEAVSASDNRTRYMRTQFQWHAARDLASAGWFMVNSPSVVFDVEMPDGQGNLKDGRFYGGLIEGVVGKIDPAQANARWDDLQIEIEPLSMEYEDEALSQKRAQDTVALLPQLAAFMIQYPFIAWKDLLEFWGDRMNHPDFSRFVDWPMLERFVQQLGQMTGGPEEIDPQAAIEQFFQRNPTFKQQSTNRPSQALRLPKLGTPGQGAGGLGAELAAAARVA